LCRNNNFNSSSNSFQITTRVVIQVVILLEMTTKNKNIRTKSNNMANHMGKNFMGMRDKKMLIWWRISFILIMTMAKANIRFTKVTASNHKKKHMKHMGLILKEPSIINSRHHKILRKRKLTRKSNLNLHKLEVPKIWRNS